MVWTQNASLKEKTILIGHAIRNVRLQALNAKRLDNVKSLNSSHHLLTEVTYYLLVAKLVINASSFAPRLNAFFTLTNLPQNNNHLPSCLNASIVITKNRLKGWQNLFLLQIECNH